MSLPASNPSLTTAEDRSQATSIKCVRCGYDLRGTDPGGRCPECGLKAYWSFRVPKQLSQFPAGWVRSMSWGVRLLAIAYGLIVVMGLLIATRLIHLSEAAFLSVFLTAGSLQIAGAWALARRSRHRSESASMMVPVLLRVTSFGLPVAWLAQLALPISMTENRIVSAIALAGFLTPPLALLRLRIIARLIANERLEKRCMLVGYGAIIVVLLYGAAMAWGMTIHLWTRVLLVAKDRQYIIAGVHHSQRDRVHMLHHRFRPRGKNLIPGLAIG